MLDDQDCTVMGSDSRGWKYSGWFDCRFEPILHQELNRLATLPDNWDGYDASPINENCIATARRLVKSLAGATPRPRVVPLSTGGVQFEWDKGGRSLEIGVDAPDEINYLKFDPASEIEECGSVASEDPSAIRSLIMWLYGR